MTRRQRFDRLLFGNTLLLTAFGSIMIYSASAVVAGSRHGGPYFFVSRQLQAVVAGLACAAVVMAIDYKHWRHRWILYPGLVAFFVMLVAVLFQPAINNTHRWLNLGFISLQPSELAKIPLIVFLAHWLDSRRDRLDDFWQTLVPMIGVVGGLSCLVLLEPDFGNSVLILVVSAAMLFLAGVGLRWFFLAAGVVVPTLYWAVTSSKYRMGRILSFLEPEAEPTGLGYQALQSLIAHGSGGLLGQGLGDGRQKLFFLPEPHTDFIYAIIGEEIGLIGAMVFFAGFCIFFWRAVVAAQGARDQFGYYLAMGLGTMIFIQALIHISVTLAILPTKGLPLPFVSFGRTSMLTSLIAAGMLLNIGQHGK